MPLTTRCGRCGRLFPVYAQMLKTRRGRVNCPQCGNRFDALAALLDEPMVESEVQSVRARLGIGGRAQGARYHPPDRAPLSGRSDSPGTASAATPSKTSRPSWGASLAWGLLSLTLLIGLIAQAAWWKRGELLRDPQAREWLSTLCDTLGCTVPAPRLPGTLTLLEPTLTPAPNSSGMVLRLKVRNDAPLSQPPPLLEVELFDPHGDLAAARRFTQAEYAPAIPSTMAPGETLAVDLTLDEPRAETSGFKVRLL